MESHKLTLWQQHVEKWKDCQLCPLAQQRSNIVLARGNIPASVIFIGEAPGASEDALGQPFRGPAGQLLDQIIERSIPNTVRVAMTNLVACFPAEAKARGDNEPELSEIKACRPRLLEFLTLAKPKLVVCVGRLASDYIQHDAYGRVCGAEVVDIIHPAFILANMPLVQKRYAVDKAVLTIRNAVDAVLQQSTTK